MEQSRGLALRDPQVDSLHLQGRSTYALPSQALPLQLHTGSRFRGARETIACAIQQEQAQQLQGIPRSPLGEAPSPLLALRPCKRGPFPPPDFLPDHVRVELLVPRAVEGVGDVQPLAIQAELHLTRATVHPLALEAQQRAGMSGPLSLSRQAKAEAAEQRSRAQWLPPLLTQLTLITKGSGWHFSSSSLHTVTGPPLRMLPPTNTWKQGSGRCVACLVTTTRY